MFLKDAIAAQSFEARFLIAGGPYEPLAKPEIAALRAENPSRFDALRATAEQMTIAAEQREAEERRQEQLKAETERREQRRAKLLSSGARVSDEMFEALVAGTHRLTPAIKAAREWRARKEKALLVLSGGTGTGKTCSAGDILLDHDDSWEWLSIQELARVFTASFGPEHTRQEQIRTCSLLIIEDLGTERCEPQQLMPTLFEIVDERQSARRTSTIITTNLTADQKGETPGFKERYPEPRLHSRLFQNVRWVALTGDDMRRVKP